MLLKTLACSLYEGRILAPAIAERSIRTKVIFPRFHQERLAFHSYVNNPGRQSGKVAVWSIDEIAAAQLMLCIARSSLTD